MSERDEKRLTGSAYGEAEQLRKRPYTAPKLEKTDLRSALTGGGEPKDGEGGADYGTIS